MAEISLIAERIDIDDLDVADAEQRELMRAKSGQIEMRLGAEFIAEETGVGGISRAEGVAEIGADFV